MPTSPASIRPLRLWPAIAIAAVIVIMRYVAAVIAPEAEVFGIPLLVLGLASAIAGAAAIAIWWLFFSRAPWSDRVFAIVVAAVGLAVTRWLVHESIAGGFMGLMLWLLSPPVIAIAVVVGAVAGQRLAAGPRRAVMAAAILLACAGFTVIRTDGITGDGQSLLHWRWTPTPEERLLAQSTVPTTVDAAPSVAPAATAPAPPDTTPPPSQPRREPAAMPQPAEAAPEANASAKRPAAAPVLTTAAWSGFRGTNRDGVVRGVRIETDWSSAPPQQLWHRPIGPGWSSFSVNGDLFYTQEQRGDHELVSCYRLATGEPVWHHTDPVRFYESNGGPGPRGTPTLHNGRVYALGATGILNALEARTGQLAWSRNAAADSGVEVPEWGVTSSPLVVGDVVVVAVSGQLVAYALHDGAPRWKGPAGGAGYSSPHLVALDGVPQIVLLRGSRTVSVSPQDGSLLWEHVWQPGVGIIQPAVTSDGGVLITTGDAMGGLGIRRIAVTRDAGGWKADERWTTRGLKPYFNDFVVHKGFAYGFDGSILSAIDLSDGSRKWKGGRYGNGQLVLLAEQDLLLVISEDGELALVQATPDKHVEVARLPALNAKTWNHPAMSGDILLIRNGEEMAAYRLATSATR